MAVACSARGNLARAGKRQGLDGLDAKRSFGRARQQDVDGGFGLRQRVGGLNAVLLGRREFGVGAQNFQSRRRARVEPDSRNPAPLARGVEVGIGDRQQFLAAQNAQVSHDGLRGQVLLGLLRVEDRRARRRLRRALGVLDAPAGINRKRHVERQLPRRIRGRLVARGDGIGRAARARSAAGSGIDDRAAAKIGLAEDALVGRLTAQVALRPARRRRDARARQSRLDRRACRLGRRVVAERQKDRLIQGQNRRAGAGVVARIGQPRVGHIGHGNQFQGRTARRAADALRANGARALLNRRRAGRDGIGHRLSIGRDGGGQVGFGLGLGQGDLPGAQ